MRSAARGATLVAVGNRSRYDPEIHGPRRVVGPGFHARVVAVVRRVPRGRVTTYGDVAAALGLARAARQVGFALAALPRDTTVPWHRVLNARGEVSRRVDGRPSPEQVGRLVGEAHALSASGRVLDFATRRARLISADASR